ncbi:NF-kappa-B-repressing factor-like [Toxorhynchites rutilus septentrionalis]|uniref:NF-kappa-B-repressing factor-like n=1 Tax=Toxorhynchites rutilus septentrionalis TaxID=329112 RepID=UPI00247A1D62|nr:NF-kappa-B-repressing factor-like [Toxorhynchites rutilus septentrionalis]
MASKSQRKRKTDSNLSWKNKIIRSFSDGWIETDNLNVTEKSAELIKTHDSTQNGIKSSKFNYTNFVKPSDDKSTSDIPDPKLNKRDIGRIKDVIGYMYNDDRISLKLTFEKAGMLLETNYDDQQQVFRYLINDREICRAEGEKQEAHTKARDKLVRIIQYYCYTVKRLKEYHTRRNVFRKNPDSNDKNKQNFKENQLDEGNIGFRMLQKQGWSGGSLGNNEEGILEPIGIKKLKAKAGFGTEDSKPEKIPIEAFMLAIKQYASGNALYDLVFSPQFSKHQVIKLKDLASSLKLFPQLIGKKKQLVISKNLTIREIMIGVQKGHSDLCAKYTVIPPICTNMK